MKKLFLKKTLMACLSAGLAPAIFADFSVDFNTAGDLTSNFSGFSDFAEAAGGGLADSGAVALSANSQVAVHQTPVDLNGGVDHVLSMYFQYNGADGDGGTGRGFFVGFTSGAADTYETSATTTGVDIRAIVAGAGSENLYGIDLQNDGANVDGSAKNVPLVIGNWYYLELTIAEVAPGEFRGVTVALYDSDASGTVGAQLKILDNNGAGGYTVTSTLADTTEAYPFFGGQNPATRATAAADNFAYTMSVPLPETTVYHGTPMAIDGIMDGAWSAQPVNTLSVDIDGTAPETADLSGYWKAMWDEDYLYFLIVTTDDTVVTWPGSQFWNYDMTELFLDMDYSRNDDVVRYDENDFQLYFPRDGQAARNNGPAPVSFPLNYAQLTDGSTTVIELALPWSELTVNPSDGMPIGVDVYMKDNDTGEASRDAQISWSPSMDEAWKNPSLFGTAVLDASPATPVTEIVNGTPDALDGTIETGWDSAPANVLAVDIDGTAPETADLSGYWKAMWDDTNLYFLIVTEDDVVVDWPGSQFWNYDTTELFLDMDYSRNDDVVRYDENDFQLYFPRDGQAARNNGPAPVTFPLNYAQVTDGTTTVIELALPWSELTVSPMAGMPIGVDVYMKDNDTGEAARDAQISWSPSMDVAWKFPALFGTGVLVSADHPIDFLALAQAMPYADGSYLSPWFGSFNPAGNWSKHTEHGWLYTGFVENTDSMLFWSLSRGSFVWTQSEAFPLVYDFETASWIYFLEIDGLGTILYDLATGDWIY
ncbi:MAG: sugar-binding protein [Oceanipulchritudo sp.]